MILRASPKIGVRAVSGPSAKAGSAGKSSSQGNAGTTVGPYEVSGVHTGSQVIFIERVSTNCRARLIRTSPEMSGSVA